MHTNRRSATFLLVQFSINVLLFVVSNDTVYDRAIKCIRTRLRVYYSRVEQIVIIAAWPVTTKMTVCNLT